MQDDEGAEKEVLLRDVFFQRGLAGTKQSKAVGGIWPHLAKRPSHSWERLRDLQCPVQSVPWVTNGEKVQVTSRRGFSTEQQKYCKVRGVEL